MAETEAIARGQEHERIRQELAAIAIIRKERIANSKIGMRRRLVAVAVASGVVCAAVGYGIGNRTSSTVQLHVIQREADTGAVPVQIATLGDGQEKATASPPVQVAPVSSMVGASSAPLPASVSNARGDSAPISQPISAATKKEPEAKPTVSVKPASAPVVQVPRRPVTVPVPVPVPVSAPVPVPVPRVVQVPSRTGAPEPTVPVKRPSVEKADPALSVVAEKATPKTPEDAEIVILPKVRKQPDPVMATKAPSPTPAQTTAFRVVNVLEGTVVVRQGQLVRQVKIGEKMPDGKILKSVNVDAGQFETTDR